MQLILWLIYGLVGRVSALYVESVGSINTLGSTFQHTHKNENLVAHKIQRGSTFSAQTKNEDLVAHKIQRGKHVPSVVKFDKFHGSLGSIKIIAQINIQVTWDSKTPHNNILSLIQER